MIFKLKSKWFLGSPRWVYKQLKIVVWFSKISGIPIMIQSQYPHPENNLKYEPSLKKIILGDYDRMVPALSNTKGHSVAFIMKKGK